MAHNTPKWWVTVSYAAQTADDARELRDALAAAITASDALPTFPDVTVSDVVGLPSDISRSERLTFGHTMAADNARDAHQSQIDNYRASLANRRNEAAASHEDDDWTGPRVTAEMSAQSIGEDEE